MEVRRPVVAVVHPDDDAIEGAESRHVRGRIPSLYPGNGSRTTPSSSAQPDSCFLSPAGILRYHPPSGKARHGGRGGQQS
jgi:hypothetical protein